MSRYGITGNVMTGVPPVYGVPATIGQQPAMTSAMFGVGGRAFMGEMPDPRASARGKRVSELKVVTEIVAKKWGSSGFEEDMPEHQVIMNVRSHSTNMQTTAVASIPQVNDLFRGVHAKHKSIGRMSRFADLDSKSQIDEFIYQMSEGPNDLFLLGVKSGRITADTRRRALDYFTIDGILSLWNVTGVLTTHVDREQKSKFVLNVAVQGPDYVTDVFSPIKGDRVAGSDGAVEARQGMHASYVLTRRFSAATGQYEEFCMAPRLSTRRYIDTEELEIEDYETGNHAQAAQCYVGEVLDVLGEERDAALTERCRGIGMPWKHAHEAIRHNDARLKIALNFKAGDAANRIS